MKKNTKRFISSVVALSMAFSSAVSTSVAVNADNGSAVASTSLFAEGSVAWSANDLETANPIASETLDLGNGFSFVCALNKGTVKSAVDTNNSSFTKGDSTVDFTQRLKIGAASSSANKGYVVYTPSADGTLYVYARSSSNDTPRPLSVFSDDALSTSVGTFTLEGAKTGPFPTAEFSLTKDVTYYIAGSEGAINLYGMEFVPSAGGSGSETTSEATTAAETTSEATTAEATSEATTAAASGGSTSDPSGSGSSGSSSGNDDPTSGSAIDPSGSGSGSSSGSSSTGGSGSSSSSGSSSTGGSGSGSSSSSGSADDSTSGSALTSGSAIDASDIDLGDVNASGSSVIIYDEAEAKALADGKEVDKNGTKIQSLGTLGTDGYIKKSDKSKSKVGDADINVLLSVRPEEDAVISAKVKIKKGKALYIIKSETQRDASAGFDEGDVMSSGVSNGDTMAAATNNALNSYKEEKSSLLALEPSFTSNEDFEGYISFDAEGGYYYYLAAEDTDDDFAIKPILAVAKVGTISGDADKPYELSDDKKQVKVNVVYEGAGINNFTGYFAYDSKLTVTDIRYEADDAEDSGAYVSGRLFSKNGKEITLENGQKAYKVAGYIQPDTKDPDKYEQTFNKITFTLNFDIDGAAEDDKLDVQFVGLDYTAGNIVNIMDAKNKSITVVSNPVTIDLAAKSTPSEVTPIDFNIKTSVEAANGVVTLDKGVTDLTVDVVASDAVDINAITAKLDFDPQYLKLDSVEASSAFSNVLSQEVLNRAAFEYAPSATNPDFADKNADGTKKAAELGRLKLAGIYAPDNVPTNVTLSKGDVIATFKFKKVAEKDGTSVVKFTNIQSTNADLQDVVTSDGAAVVTVAAVAEETQQGGDGKKSYHLLGDMDHDAEITALDASKALRGANNKDDVEHAIDLNIGDVDNDSDLTALDASDVLKKANDQDVVFSRTSDVKEDTDGKKYVSISEVPEDLKGKDAIKEF